MDQDSIEYPKSVGRLKRVECRSILNKALNASGISSQAELAELTDIDRDTLERYFAARKTPSQQDWNTIADFLSPEGKYFSPNLNAEELEGALHHSDKLEALVYILKTSLFLLKDELEYFKNSPAEARKILDKKFPYEEAHFVVNLFKAFYNENVLLIWNMF